MSSKQCCRPEVGQVFWMDEEIAEVSLLMPGWLAAELMHVADSRRLTVGQLLRGLIDEYLMQNTTGKPNHESETPAPDLVRKERP
jgi:hypothetical protein